jgi:murein hydrolase activator
MRTYYFLIVVAFCFLSDLRGQTRAELEAQRKRTFDENSYVDNLIPETSKEKESSINDLKIIGNKLNLRESVIVSMREEINLVTNRIELNKVAIEMMENDLIILKKDYAKTIVNSYRSGKGNPEIGFLLSAKDFNQGYKRLRYLRQVTKFRRRESEIIIELKNQIEVSKRKLEDDLEKISDLKHREEQQKALLQQEQDKKKRLVNTLGNKEKQLRKDLEEKKRITQKLEREILKIIEEEKKKALASELAPEQRLIGENFADNKGRLPWPVEKGIITSQFGIQHHPVLEYLTEINIGIEITSSGVTKVRSVFKGQVVEVFAISGANLSVIIRHGRYMTIYHNIVKVKVKKGDNVDIKQDIGEVFCDTKNGNTSILKFLIFEEKEKYIDPEQWITKKI